MRSALWGLLLVLITGCATHSGSLDTTQRAKSEQEILRMQLKHHYDLGENLYKNGKLDEAAVEFKKMLELVPGEPNASYRLGTIAFKQADYDKSASYFEDTIKGNPKNYKAHYNLASIRLMQSENHFKYYAALVDPDTDLEKVSKLMADINQFNNKHPAKSNEQSLDQLAVTIKK